MAKVKGTLKNGFKFAIDPAVLDDMELVDAMAESEGDNPLMISTVINKLLGPEQKKKLYDHIRTKDGRVPVEKVAEMVGEIMDQMGEEGKNS